MVEVSFLNCSQHSAWSVNIIMMLIDATVTSWLDVSHYLTQVLVVLSEVFLLLADVNLVKYPLDL